MIGAKKFSRPYLLEGCRERFRTELDSNNSKIIFIMNTKSIKNIMDSYSVAKLKKKKLEYIMIKSNVNDII